ncbi:MAG: hypothetical protein WA996_12940 [Candidatus Promineifilaceae bacterium]
MSEESVLKAEINQKRDKPLLPVLLITAGLVLLVVNVLHIHLIGLLWPGFIVGTGLLMMWPVYKSTQEQRSRLSFLAIPGAMTIAMGALLFLMNLFGHYESMAYAWTLILAAGAAGYLYQRRFDEQEAASEKARGFIRITVLSFMAMAAVFELLIFQSLGGWWPLLVIGFGLYLWVKESRSEVND